MSLVPTGQVSKVRVQPLAVWEYTDLSHIPRMMGDSPDDAIPTLRDVFHKPVVEAKLLRLVDKKWVTLFIERNGAIYLLQEGFVSIENKKQVIQFVDWSSGQRTQRHKETIRPLAGPKTSGWTVDVNQKAWVVMSQEQMPLYRMDAYQKNRALLDQRAQVIEPTLVPASANGKTPINIYLVDPLHIASGLAKAYTKAGEAFNTSESNEDNQLKRAFHGMIYSVANAEKKVKTDWLDWAKFKADADQLKSHDEQVKHALGQAEAWLFCWKISHFFQLAWRDLSGYPEIETKALDRVEEFTSLSEVRYLTWEMSQKDSWYNKVMQSATDQQATPNAFQFGRKMAQSVLDGKLALFIDQWILGRSLAIIAASKLKKTDRLKAMEQLVDEIEDVIIKHKWSDHVKALNPDRRTRGAKKPRHFFSGIADFHGLAIGHYFSTFYEGIQYAGPGTETPIQTKAQRDSFLAGQKNKCEALSKLDTIGKSIFMGLEAVNLVVAVGDLRTSMLSGKDQAKNVINTIGSISDLAVTLEYLVQSKAATKAGKKVITKVFLHIAIVGDVTDFVGAGMDGYSAFSQGKYAVFAGNLTVAVSAVAAIAAGIGGLMALGGASVGLAAIAGPLGWIAIGLYIIGNLIIFYFTESELETWCRDSRWGKSTFLRSSQYVYNPKTGIKGEFRSLIATLCAIKPTCYIEAIQGTLYMGPNGNYYDYTYNVVVEVTLGALFNQGFSKLHFSIEVLRDRLVTSNSLAKQEITLEPDQGYIEVKNGRALRWRKSFPAPELGIHGDPRGRAYDFQLTKVYLNLNGGTDASECYPDKDGLFASGDLEVHGH